MTVTIVETGKAKGMIFPPVNAPDNVKDAWDEAITGASESEIFALKFRMHIAVYGINVDAHNTDNLPPEE